MNDTTPRDSKGARPPLDSSKDWPPTDEQLASTPLSFRDGLLQGQVFVISGGGSGIGRGIAFVLARLGANVVICGSEEGLTETAATIGKLVGREVMTKAMTTRDPQQVDALMEETWERYGRIDVLVNNGGGEFPQAAIDFSVKGWLAVIDTHLNGTWYMMQSAARQWRKHHCAGSIVNIVAVVNRGMPQVAHTCAARAGVMYLSKTLAVEWAPLNVRVNCVAPGTTASGDLKVYPHEAAQQMRNSNPIRRLGDVFDVAEAVVYLSAPSGKFITGEMLAVDSGPQQWGED